MFVQSSKLANGGRLMTGEGEGEVACEQLASAEQLEAWVKSFAGYRQPPTKEILCKWLSRFKPEHLGTAHKVLDAVIVVSEREIHQGYRDALTALPGWSKSSAARKGRWFFVGVGAAGESGSMRLLASPKTGSAKCDYPQLPEEECTKPFARTLSCKQIAREWTFPMLVIGMQDWDGVVWSLVAEDQRQPAVTEPLGTCRPGGLPIIYQHLPLIIVETGAGGRENVGRRVEPEARAHVQLGIVLDVALCVLGQRRQQKVASRFRGDELLHQRPVGDDLPASAGKIVDEDDMIIGR
jgi:hypothetical protein